MVIRGSLMANHQPAGQWARWRCELKRTARSAIHNFFMFYIPAVLVARCHFALRVPNWMQKSSESALPSRPRYESQKMRISTRSARAAVTERASTHLSLSLSLVFGELLLSSQVNRILNLLHYQVAHLKLETGTSETTAFFFLSILPCVCDLFSLLVKQSSFYLTWF